MDGLRPLPRENDAAARWLAKHEPKAEAAKQRAKEKHRRKVAARREDDRKERERVARIIFAARSIHRNGDVRARLAMIPHPHNAPRQTFADYADFMFARASDPAKLLAVAIVVNEHAEGCRRSHAVHELKIHPEPFQAVRRGEKTAEFRRDDRGFEVGDRIVLREWESPRIGGCYDPGRPGRYTGESLPPMIITDIRRGGTFGIPEGFAILSIKPDPHHRHPVKMGRSPGFRDDPPF